MLKGIILAVAIMFVIVCALFNFRVSWANINGKKYHDRRLVYFVVAEMATVAAALIAYLTKGSWLIKTAMACENAGYENSGLAYLFLLVMGVVVVLMTGAAVYCAGAEGEDLWWHKAAKH